MNRSACMDSVVISMTSFPPAIGYAEKALKSLFEGSVLPDKIVLYLTFDEFPGRKIPDSLLKLAKANPIFEIRDYPENIRSYRKLVPALEDFPDSVIVTVDDDISYHRDMLKDLLELHKKFPHDIIAHRAKKINLDKAYKKWKKYRWYHFLRKRIYRSPLIMQTGVAGVLYPPHSLRQNMIDDKLFGKLAPTTDDVWFWAAAVANGRTVIPVPFGKNKPKDIGKPKELSLKKINFKSGEDRNSKALKAILEAFPELEQKLKEDKKL